MAKKKKTQEEIEQEKAKKAEEARKKYLKEADEKLAAFQAELDMTQEELIIRRNEKRIAELQAKNIKLEIDKARKEREEVKKLRSEDTRKKILIGAFMMADKKRFNYCLSSPEFDKFLERDIDKKLFRLTKPEASESKAEEKNHSEEPKAEEKNSSAFNFEARSGGGVYLDVPFDYNKIAKSLGAAFDNNTKKWYAPDGTDPEPIQRAVEKAIAEAEE